jgi:hypothetical protein
MMKLKRRQNQGLHTNPNIKPMYNFFARWRKAYAVESLTGTNLGMLTPSWAGVAVDPVGLREKLKEKLSHEKEPIIHKQPVTRRSGSLYLRAALNNSIREEKRIS